MLCDHFSWREKRCWLHSIPRIPHYIDTHGTTLPEGNAHYSMYGITEASAKEYQRLMTKKHVIYPHYSSEIILDVETLAGLEDTVNICVENEWNFKVYETGSRNAGGHIAIERDALPSEELYMKDRCFVMKHFPNIPDIDHAIYNTHMHLIRGIGRIHEQTHEPKQLLYVHKGSVLPSVQTLEILDVFRHWHEQRKYNLQVEVNSDWTKFQKVMQKHSPDNLVDGKKYIRIYLLAKDMFKCGADSDMVRAVVALFVSQAESKPRNETVSKAINDAYKAVNNAAGRE